ncbi:sensor histidine kinase [Nonomuraea sp. LPB2021202275-12-8]|uniref:sensor histidine kinase n=1 Tax=Nonomuraea sp. LPB2021202275-12-8 TaxID=3120159 RepID=UPI00300D0353
MPSARTAADELIQPVASGWILRLFAVLFTAPLWFAATRAGSAGELATILAFVAGYVLTSGWAVFRPVAVRAWGCAAVTVTAAVFVVGYGHDPLYFSFPVALLAIMLPWLWAVLTSGSLTVVVVLVDSLMHGGLDLKLIVMLAVLLSGLGIGGFWRLAQQLRRANATIARMAVHEDRKRLARDLHDSVGSALTTITVKAGLVRRLLEEGAHDAVLAEVKDVESLGRQALKDVRASIEGNHVLSLATALSSARAALVAAGIRPDLPRATDEVPVVCEQIFAYILQEGVTNVIKHSRAVSCRVVLGPTFIEICDDGLGHAGGEPGTGHGLSGLAGRLSAIGGSLEAGPLPRGYRLRAECPPMGVP